MSHPGPGHQGAQLALTGMSLHSHSPARGQGPPTLLVHAVASVTRHTHATATKFDFSIVTKDNMGQLPNFKVFSHVPHLLQVMIPQHEQTALLPVSQVRQRGTAQLPHVHRAARGIEPWSLGADMEPGCP